MSKFNFLGLPFGKDFTFVGQNKLLNKNTGAVVAVDKIMPQVFTPVPAKPSPAPVKVPQIVEIKKEVEYVIGIDKQVVDLSLATSAGRLPSAGFLVEVFLSGADGKLTRVYKEDIVDAVNDETLPEGFSNYLILEVDK
jgi:hypothetical protein